MRVRKGLVALATAGGLAIGAVGGAVLFAPGVTIAQEDASGASQDTDETFRRGVCVFGHGELLSVAAETIGVSEAELLASLRDGDTIAEVAEANGVEAAAVVDALASAAEERLDAAVDDGLLSEEEAEERKDELRDRVEALVNREILPHRLGPFARFGPGPWGPSPGLWGADGTLGLA